MPSAPAYFRATCPVLTIRQEPRAVETEPAQERKILGHVQTAGIASV